MKRLLVLTILVFSVSTVNAQEGKITLGFALNSQGDYNRYSDSVDYRTFSIGYRASESLTFELAVSDTYYDRTPLNGSPSTLLRREIRSTSFNLLYSNWRQNAFEPFVFAGIGYLDIKLPSNVQTLVPPEDDSSAYTKNKMTFQAGIGFAYHLGDHLSVNIRSGYTYDKVSDGSYLISGGMQFQF